jgi:hypothetical protein
MKTQLTIFLMLCLSFSTKSSLSQSTLNWGTYIGGEFGASITDVAVSNGYVAVVGSTTSAENIAFGDNIHQSYLNNVAGEPLMLRDAYVALYTLEGELQWCTYFGGELDERANSLVFDGEFITIVGSTESSLDISTQGAFQESFGGGNTDAFIAKFNLQGELLWASYYGGDGNDYFTAIDLESSLNSWVTGYTTSLDFSTVNAIQSSHGGGIDAVILSVTPDGNVTFSTYLGGSENDSGGAIEVLGSGVYITGEIQSESQQVGTPYQSQYSGMKDAFIACIQDSELVALTYYGGVSNELTPDLFGVNERLFITGSTASSTSIALNTSYQQEYAGGGDGYFGEFSSDLSNLIHSSYCGGAEDDDMSAVSGFEESIFLIGASNSSGLASPNAFQNEVYEEGEFNDFIIFQFNLDGGYQHSTYFGGEGGDFGTSIHSFSDTQVIFGGNSNSSGLSTQGAHQEQLYSGWMHGYLGLMDFGVGIDEGTTPPSQLKIYPNPSAGHVRLQSRAFSEGERVTISIYNMHGQAVQQSTTAFNTNMELDLKDLSNGVYEVLLTNGVSSVRERLIVK